MIALVAKDEKAWRQLCSAVGLEELPKEERFLTNEDRLQHREELDTILRENLRGRPAAEWIEELRLHGVDAGPVASLRDIVRDDHLSERGVFEQYPHTLLHEIRMARGPIRIGTEPGKVGRAAPLLGEHNTEVIGRMLGHSPQELKRMRDEKII